MKILFRINHVKDCVPTTSVADGVGCNCSVTHREVQATEQCGLVNTECVIEAKLQAHNKKENRKKV